jgi:hypothetical protein
LRLHKIADRVEVTVALKVDRVSGPPLVFKQWFKRDFELGVLAGAYYQSPREKSPG